MTAPDKMFAIGLIGGFKLEALNVVEKLSPTNKKKAAPKLKAMYHDIRWGSRAKRMAHEIESI